MIDPAEWSGAATFEGLVDSETGDPAPAGVEGTFYLGYDEQFIYFAGQMTAPDPGRVRADEYRNNVSLSGDDSITLSVDPFGTRNDFSHFAANARGATQISISGGRAAKTEWQGQIQARGQLTPTGYSVEMRIPWSIMALPTAGERVVRVNASRYTPGTGRTYVWKNTQGDRFDQYGRWEPVMIPAVKSGRTFDLLPYAYGGVSDDGDAILNSGIDFKTSLSSELTAVGTINPDFRNIESQILGLEFSYFERLAGESRPFFAEGRDYFQAGGLFASQRVRSFDAGARFFGKLGGRSSIGLMSLSDFGEKQVLLGRVTRQFSPVSSGMVVVTNLAERGKDNLAARASYNHSLGNYSLYGFGAVTEDQIEGSGHAAEVGFYYGHDGLEGGVELQETSPDFFPRLGFWPERDYRAVSGWMSKTQLMSSRGLSETQYSFNASKAWRTDGSDYRYDVGGDLSLTWGNGLDLDFGANVSKFEQFHDYSLSMSVEKPRRDPYRRWSLDATMGRLGGEEYRRYGVNLSYRPLPRLQTYLSLQRVEHFETGQQLIFSANWDLSYTDTVGGRLIVREGEAGGYLSFRRTGSTGAEYFLIVGDPSVVRWRPQVILKAVFPFSVRI